MRILFKIVIVSLVFVAAGAAWLYFFIQNHASESQIQQVFQKLSFTPDEQRLLDQFSNHRSAAAKTQVIEESRFQFQSIFHRLLLKALHLKYYQKLDSAAATMTTARAIASIYETLGDHFLLAQCGFADSLNAERLYRKMVLEIWYDIGWDSLQSQDFSQARHYLKKSYRQSCKIGDLKRQIDNLSMLHYLLYAEGKQKRALALANQCLTLASQIHYQYREIWARFDLATSFFDLGNYKEALPHLKKGLALAHLLQDQHSIMSLQERISIAYRQLGNLTEATHAIEDAMRIGEQRKDRKNQIRCLINVGLIDKTGGDYTKAQQNFEKALALAQQEHDPNEAAALENLGDLYRILGEYDNALIHHFDGLEVNNKSRNYYRIARNQRYIGDVYRDQGDLVHAIDYYQEALEIVKRGARGVQPKRLESEIWLSIGDIQKSQQKFQAATTSYQRALATFKSIEVLEGVAGASIRIGNVLRDSQQLDQALVYFEQGLDIAQQIAQPILKWNAFYGMGLVFRDRSDFSAAKQAFSSAIAVVDSTRGKIFTDEEKINYFACHQDLYDDMILLCYDQGDAEAAFNFSESSRCRSFFDLLSGKAEILKSQDSVSAADSRLNVWNPMQGKPFTLQEIQQTLPDDILAIEYKITSEKLLIFVIDKTKLSVRESQIEKQALQELVWQYRQAIGAEAESEFKQKVASAAEDVFNRAVSIANQLYSATLTPIEDLLARNKIICIIPNDALFYVPFEALIAPNDTMKKFMIEDYTLVYAASASILKYSLDHQKVRPKPDQMKLLAIGNPTGDLIGAEKEVKNIAQLFPKSQQLLGEIATEDTIMKILQESFDVIHIATHGVVEESNPLYSYLALGKPGKGEAMEQLDRSGSEIGRDPDLLMTYEVYDLNLAHTQLITLSACRTACGRMFRGEGIVGMNRAFMKAGAASVISSFWKVDDKYTERIMTNFYDQWQNRGMTRADALRNARLSLLSEIRNNKLIKYPHPFLWAAFVLTGDYH